MIGFIVIGSQSREPFVAHQHQKALLGKIGWGGWVKARGPILDGVQGR